MFVILFIVLWFFASAWCLMVGDRTGTRERKWSWATLLPAVFSGALLAIAALSLLCFLSLWIAEIAFPDEGQAGNWWDRLLLSSIAVMAYLLLFGLLEVALKVFLQEFRMPLWPAVMVQVPFLSFTLFMVSERVTMGPPLSPEVAVTASSLMAVLGYVMEKCLGFHPI